ncbi:alpha/beta fold hydrolase [Cognatiyoonia sp. IB215446]|uniref:alpha/beta hydrolase family protein n=1 Tax=Cognatiyoonia sp. IB215446 TaxID=3097355 RepID=UPI002A0B80EB|nr:alpha/beta fold hydrolase [Cognatiyoonia sp. IB215446]MDX8349775.1 alpha/beta fold hydrolase [Cognatiyoonia sp. IB215446]
MNIHAGIGYEDQWFYSGGQKLRGRFFGTYTRPRAVAVLHGATGVPQRYYAKFARWLAEARNIACLTYDYRDFASSARGPMKTSTATMADWGVHDQQAARDHLRGLVEEVPLWVIGHSLGGMMLPFQKDLDQIDRVIAIASGPAHVAGHPYPYKLYAAAYWYAVGPPATYLAGYMPGKRLGFGNDIPAGVFWQWRRWCTKRGFFAGDIGAQLPMPDWYGVKAPVKVVAIKDDALIPPKSVWGLMDYYRAADKTQLVVDPDAYDLDGIGHIAPFAEVNRAIWADLIA